MEKSRALCPGPSLKPIIFNPITINGTEIERVQSFKLLGVFITCDLTWNRHINYITSKASRSPYLLTQYKKAGLSTTDLLNMFNTLIRSVLEYACPVWHPAIPKYLSDELETIQIRALKIILPKCHSYEEALTVSKQTRLSERRDTICKKFFQTMCKTSDKIHHLLPPRKETSNLRSGCKFAIPKARTDRFKNSFIVWGSRLS